MNPHKRNLPVVELPQITCQIEDLTSVQLGLDKNEAVVSFSTDPVLNQGIKDRIQGNAPYQNDTHLVQIWRGPIKSKDYLCVNLAKLSNLKELCNLCVEIKSN